MNGNGISMGSDGISCRFRGYMMDIDGPYHLDVVSGWLDPWQ